MTQDKIGNERTILTHAVVIGLTALIPVPIVDDMVKAYFQRRLVRKLAESHGRVLVDEDVGVLAEDAGGGGCLGCFFGALLYPILKLLRKLAFFLELKRSVDTVSLVAHHMFLVDHVLKMGWLAPEGRHAAPAVRSAIDHVTGEASIRPVETAVRKTFRNSRKVLFGAAAVLWKAVAGLTRASKPDEVQSVLEPLASEEGQRIEGVVEALQRQIDAIPREHFERLTARLAAMLGER
jgi:hypothetical protein